MSYLVEKSSIETFFQDNWTETPIFFENTIESRLEEWVRLTILNGDAYQASMGDDPAFRYPGVVIVQIRIRKDLGSGRAVDLADIISEMFTNLVLGAIRFKVPRLDRGPIDQEWFILNVSVDFYRGS